jgi:urease accessory protein
MFAVISPSDHQKAAPGRMHGVAEVGFTFRDGKSRLAHLHQMSPLRVMFPDPADGDPPTAALIAVSGGLVGGDRLDLRLSVGEGAAGLFVAQAAEKVYRSSGADGCIGVHLAAGAGAWLEYLPQETILFEGARLRRDTVVEAAASARVMAGEILVFGRQARGERLVHGLVRDVWRVERDGRLVWADALHLDGEIGVQMDNPAAFAGAVACATVTVIIDDPSPLLELARARLADYGGRGGASVVNDILVIRWLDHDALRLRRSFGDLWSELRFAAAGLPKRLPRLWHV